MRLADLNAETLRKLYLFGVVLKDEDGNELEDGVLDFYIQAAIKKVESFLNINITPEVDIVERGDYRQDVWRNFAFMQLRRRPISSIKSLYVKFGDSLVFEVPPTWMRIEPRMGQVHLFPALGAFSSVPALGMAALSPALLRADHAPHIFETTYSVGMSDIDEDLAEAILSFASLNIFNVMGDIVIGPGIASFSMGLDGLSQSLTTTASSEHTAYGARIKTYMDGLFGSRVGDPGLMHALRAKWRIIPAVTL